MKKSILIILITFSIYGLYGKGNFTDNHFQKPAIRGQNSRVDYNNIDLSVRNNGAIGGEGDSYYPNGTNWSFIYSGGIGISAYDTTGELRISWIFPSSRIYDFMPGISGMDPDDPKAKFYYVNQSDSKGSLNFIEWADAVALGADFVDVNGDGQYDPSVDTPDLIGQFTIWFVINDSMYAGYQGFINRKKVGVEIYQTIFGFFGNYGYGDVIFFRYRIRNISGVDLNNAIFSFFLDPNIGDYIDDLAGCNPEMNLGYAYNYGNDDQIYGTNPPAVGVDLLQGAIVASPGDTARIHRGPDRGISILPDYKNLPMTSFMIMDQGSSDLSDPTFASQGRNFMEGGLYPTGDPIDPLKFYRGSGATNESNPKFLFDGDPVNGTGWVNSVPGDIRILINNGPFSFGMDTEQEIIYALMVTQGTDALNSVTRLLELDPRVQALYDSNFDLIKLLAINNQNKNLPGSFSLGDPYPNPFNPVVYIPLNISFAPSNTKIHVGIYNISGELVWDKTIISRERTHTIKWEGTTLEGKAAPSGMYFVRVTDGVITQTRRIVLLK